MFSVDYTVISLSIKIFVLVVVSLLSYKKKYLDVNGIMSAVIVGGIIIFLGGWIFFILLLIFLLVGSILSKTGREETFDFSAYFNGGSIRGWKNVIANGFWPMYSAIMYYLLPASSKNYAVFLFLGSLSSMMSDTVSTEIGLYFGGEPVLITNPKRKVPKGYSGGVTLIGLLGGAIASIIFSFIAVIFLDLYNPLSYLILVLSGFLGSIFDSFLGALIQAKYRCEKCGAIVETKLHCGYNTVLIKGYESIDNHMVNFLSSLFGGVLAVISYSLLL